MSASPPPLPGGWVPLCAHASARLYWRGAWEGEPALFADFGDDLDGRKRFICLSRWLPENGIRVPKLFAAPPGERWVVQEFVPGEDASHRRWDRALEAKAFAVAGSFAALEEARWPCSLPLHRLDGDRLRFELAFFDLHFLQGLLNLPQDADRRRALDGLAEEVAGYPPLLAHRDYHSDNLRVADDGALVVLDFQDLLVAPRCYDVASLSVDAYRRTSAAFRARCESWCGERWGVGREEFGRTALQRALKALGTFGFQVTRRKRPGYLAAAAATVPRALGLLAEGPSSLAGLYPVLAGAERVL